MSQMEIARYLGMTQPAVSNNLTGKTVASPTTLSCLVILAKERSVTLPAEAQWRTI